MIPMTQKWESSHRGGHASLSLDTTSITFQNFVRFKSSFYFAFSYALYTLYSGHLWGVVLHGKHMVASYNIESSNHSNRNVLKSGTQIREQQ